MARPHQLITHLRLAVASILLISVTCQTAFDYEQFGLDWSGSCRTGDSQSPIDIVTSRTIQTTTNKFSLSYEDVSKVNLSTNGHAFYLTLAEDSMNILNTPEGPYRLVQFHFHTFSEHTINGLFGPLEVHFVHANKNATKLAVFGVVFRLDKNKAASPFLANFVDKLPTNTTTKTPLTLSLKPFLQPGKMKTLNYYTYTGSLTTPPCTEIVTWYVRQKFATASVEDIEAFLAGVKALTGDPLDDRFPTPIDGRKVFKVKVT